MSRRALTRPPAPGATLDARVSKIERAAVQVDVTFITPLEEKRKKKRLRQRFSGGSFQGGDELEEATEPLAYHGDTSAVCSIS